MTFGQRLDLSEDYRAIRWMQDNVQGSPVIVEANCPEYRWCSRLHDLHRSAWRGGLEFPSTPATRLRRPLGGRPRECRSPTSTPPLTAKFARDFLNLYDVRYIIVGQLERAEYRPEGVAQWSFPGFERYIDGTRIYWRSVYSTTGTRLKSMR